MKKLLDLFKVRKKEPEKILQFAYYIIYLQNDYHDRGRYIHLKSYKLNYALFLMDFKHRAETGEFLFKDDAKIFGEHGFYYASVALHIGLSANMSLYSSYEEKEELLYIKYLTNEERKNIEDFLEKHYSLLGSALYSGKSIISFLTKETQDYLTSENFPNVSTDIFEELYRNISELKCPLKTKNTA